ncbi:uncharacterized protein V6R79_018521 [Siganus canaliculatus]
MELTPEEDALEHILACRDKPTLEEKPTDSIKGRGVFTCKAIKASSFVVEYRGKVSSIQKPRPKQRCGGDVFEFSWDGGCWRIDASSEDGSLGRLVKDDPINPNCEVKKIVSDGKPHLCLFAVKEISAGDEITYSYRDSTYPWRLRDSDGASSREKSDSDDDDDEVSEEENSPSKSKSKTHTRRRTSRNYCFVCGIGVVKISRHYIKHIDEEPDIAKVYSLRKNSKERIRLLSELRNRGNYKHNQEVLKNNDGELKLKRRRNDMVASGKTHVTCLYCKAMYHRKEVWRHVARCSLKPESKPAAEQKKRVISKLVLAQSPFSKDLSPPVYNLLAQMKADEVALAVQNDFLLIKLAESLHDKYGSSRRRQEYIRQTLREMGRLLVALREESVSSFEDAIKPENFDKVVQTVRNIAGFKVKTQSYSKPNLALKLGHSLKKIGVVAVSHADGNAQMTSNAKTFIKCCARQWAKLVARLAVTSLRGRKVKPPSTMAFTRDVQVFHGFLETTAASALENLTAQGNPESYRALCRVLLAQMFLLNKTECEVSKMTLKTFQERDETTQVLSKHFIRINIVSRNNVTILLTSGLVSSLTLLVNKRELCGVHPKNPFLFAKPDSTVKSVFHGANCIRVFSAMCGAKSPENLRSVHLHKHMARVFQFLNLENDEISHLSKLLGHDIRADRDYYRRPESAVELAKIAKLILAMEKGSLDRFKGSSLEEVEIEGSVEQQTDVNKKNMPLSPKDDALQHIKTCRDKPFLEEMYIDKVKGSGVFTHEEIEPSMFVVEFRGNILPQIQTRTRTRGDAMNNFVFSFSWKGSNWCVDASQSDDSLGRLVNDDHLNPNCEVKKIVYKGKPHVCLFALKKISPDEEITFDYGDQPYPWRLEESSEKTSRSQTDGNDAASLSEDESADSDSYSGSNDEYKPDKAQCSDDSSNTSEPEDISDSDSASASGSNKPFCYVCGKAFSKMSRHLYTHRKQMPEIAEAFALPRSSKERSGLLAELRNRGNYKHNQKVLKTQRGTLKVGRKRADMAPEAFALCLYCRALYVRKGMWRHMQTCPSKPQMLTGKTKVLAFATATEMADLDQSSPELMEFLKKMRKDEIAAAVHSDPLLLKLGHCYSLMRAQKRKEESIIHRLRLMGRLLLILRKKSISSFEDAVTSVNFGKVVEAVKELAGSDEASRSGRGYGVTMKLAGFLKKMGLIKVVQLLKADADKQELQEVEEFNQLCAKEWRPVTQSKASLKKLPVVAFVQDVQLFCRCIESTAASALESLTLYENAQVYNALLRVTAAQVSIFNKNSDVSKVTLSSFNERTEAQVSVGQSQFDQILSGKTMRVALKDNKGKNVTVILTPKLLETITLLVSKRDTCGVHKSNPFLFARPVPICTSFFSGHQCVTTLVSMCGAKNPANLRSVFFRKHVTRVFQILSLDNEELGRLAQHLGRDIRTDREYYQTPEAAVDIAKILELLSAMENKCMELYEGKSLEEIEVGELEPDMEPDYFENSDAEENDEQSRQTARKRSRSRKKKQEPEKEAAELSKEKQDEANAEKKETPQNRDVKAPEKTRSRSDDRTMRMSFSDDDDDMHVDFDVDSVQNEDGDGDDDDARRSPAAPWVPALQDMSAQDDDSGSESGQRSPEKDVAAQENDVNNDSDEDEADELQDEDSGASSGSLRKEKKVELPAALTGMKQVKILIPKLDINKFKSPVHISQLSPMSSSVKTKNIPDQRSTSNSAADPAKPNSAAQAAKEIQMTCSHCQTTMSKGQTAYQKKGFTDVFCSKNCLFEKFPVNKRAAKTCHYCQKVISQLLDLIMASVDVKGTMKDFCSVTCLCSFKTPNTVPTQALQPVCSMCNKSCTVACQLSVCETEHRFCCDSCLEEFCRKNGLVCEICDVVCKKKQLTLKLKDQTKTICSDQCLNTLKEQINTSHPCTMCDVSLPVSGMFSYKSSENTVELFCTLTCATSFSLRPANFDMDQVKMKRKQRADSEESDVPALVNVRRDVSCCCCGKKLWKGQEIYLLKSSNEIFCSISCFSGKYPHVNVTTKTCFSCLQVITRPRSMILAPVDDSGAMKELCSNACLLSVNNKKSKAVVKHPPCSTCTVCSRFVFCKLRRTLDGLEHKICSEVCFINYHRTNNLPVFPCDVCSSVCNEKRLVVTMEDDVRRDVCSEECLVKFKENIETPQLCPTCQTLHQMSDMVENKSADGRLRFFCSSRCVLVHEAQGFTASADKGPSRLTVEETDVKEVKLQPNLHFIKEEPTDEEYDQSRSSSVTEIKVETNPKEEVDAVFLSTAETEPPSPAATSDMVLPECCSNCKKALIDGETVYQRKARPDIFCSSSCLLNFYQMKQVKKTCHFCLQTITQLHLALQAPVDSEETMKDFCSQTCLSSFSYKTVVSTKMPTAAAPSQSQCSMCSRYCISKHELLLCDVIYKMCSDPCFRRFCTMNNLSVCENCDATCSAPLVLRMEEGSRKLCSPVCLAQFKQKVEARQPCAMCHAPRSVVHMVENKNSDGVVELFCANSCMMAAKIQAISEAGAPLACDHCGKSTLPACHFAMSDASVKNFCTLTCAMHFKEAQNAAAETSAASDQCDVSKPPEQLPCAQCRGILKSAPRVIQTQDNISFVCSLACSREFKKANNVTGKCENCQNDRIIEHPKRVENRVCNFCSDGCKMLFRLEMEKQRGGNCHVCAYCLSISKTMATARYKGQEKKFCSDECKSRHKMLVSNAATCDACGQQGKLRQSLSLLREVKHFCDLKCLLHFCNKQLQKVNAVSSPPRSAGAADPSLVITNVISLADAVAQKQRASERSARHVSTPDIQTKVVGHASVQTVPKEVRNKATLCTPLVHNKGAACTPRTADTEAQTGEAQSVSDPHIHVFRRKSFDFVFVFFPVKDDFSPRVRVRVLPVPVPVPVYVPLPMNMYSQITPRPVGLPLPLPVPMLVPVRPNHRDSSVNSRKEKTAKKRDRDQDQDQDQDQLVAEKRQRADVPPPGPRPAVETSEDLQSSSRLQQTEGKVKKKKKKQESRKKRALGSGRGIEAWKRWIHCRESQSSPASSRVVRSVEDLLRCSSTELSDSLCCFVSEATRPDGETYSADALFHLCLSVQQYLFENGRMENIFCDLIYNKFSVTLTKILRGFRASVSASGLIRCRVEEDFLWDCKQLGACSPIVLLNTLLFFCCKHFGFTTVEQHRQLAFAHATLITTTQEDNSEASTLRFSPPAPGLDGEPDGGGGVPAKRSRKHGYEALEIPENTENPLRCPVRLFEFYLSKCSASVKRSTTLFLLHPERSCVPSSPVWFSSTPLDDRVMDAMLVRILCVRELQRTPGSRGGHS